MTSSPSANGEETAPLIQGVDEAIVQLHHKGYRMGVVSSGSERRVGRELERSGLKALFEVIICNEHIVRKKPHPEGLEKAMQVLEVTNAESCYVGDAFRGH